jgi:hypothetical protein
VNKKGNLIFKPLPAFVSTWSDCLEDEVVTGQPDRPSNQHDDLHEERFEDSKLETSQGILK